MDKKHLVTGLFMDWAGRHEVVETNNSQRLTHVKQRRLAWWMAVTIVSWNHSSSQQWRIAPVCPSVCMNGFSLFDMSSRFVIDFFCSVFDNSCLSSIPSLFSRASRSLKPSPASSTTTRWMIIFGLLRRSRMCSLSGSWVRGVSWLRYQATKIISAYRLYKLMWISF